MNTALFPPDRELFRQILAQVAAKATAPLPESNGRVEKAVALVLAGDVEGREDDGSWRVGSATSPLTTHRVQGTHCSCDDSQYGRAPRGLCKHVLAVMITMRVQELLPPVVEWPPDEPLAPASTPVDRPSAALPEAPCSVNCYLTVAGRQVQVTLRGTHEWDVLARLEKVLERYPVPQPHAASPASPQPLTAAQHNAKAMHRPVSGYCAVHNTTMVLNT